MRLLTREEIARQLPAGWAGEPDRLTWSCSLPSFRAAIDVVDEVADDAEEMDHHPDVDIRFRRLEFALSTHSAGGVTQLDIELAHRIADIVRRHGGTDSPVA